MKYCEHCGSKIENTATFCPNCGAKFEVKEVVQPTPVNNPQQNQSQMNTSGMPADNTTVAAFVCSLVGLLFCCTIVAIPGLVLSIISLVNMNNGKIDSSKKNLAIASIIISSIALLMSIFAILNGSIISGFNSIYE